LSTRHGAYSPRKVVPAAEGFVAAVLRLAAVPGSPVAYLSDPTYVPAVEAWGRSEAQQDLLEAYLDRVGGPIDSDGRVRPAAELLERVARRAERLRARLGLDPMARASLSRDLAVARSSHDLDRLKTLGQMLLDASGGGGDTTVDEEKVDRDGDDGWCDAVAGRAGARGWPAVG
jgi:hypothetical protein